MLPAERKRTIVELVTERDGCSVAELAAELEFSKATIRRDLRDLAEAGRLERSHGGAVPSASVGAERPYGQREVARHDAKRAIAERAWTEISEGQVVCFDSGTTTLEVARAATEATFEAATNMPDIATELADQGVEVRLTGGSLRPRSRSLVGPTAEAFLERTNYDLCFLGTNGIHARVGLSTPNEAEAAVKTLMVERADRVVLVADSAKFGARSFASFADLDAVDVLVTDGQAEDPLATALEDAGVSVAEVSA